MDVRRHVEFHRFRGVFLLHLRPPQGRAQAGGGCNGSLKCIREAVMSSIAKTVVRAYQNYINGQWVKSSTGEVFPVYDPSTEEVIAQVASANAADIDRAVKAARAAFDSGPWPQTSAAERAR